ncbi:sugar isomerase domain-containing protein [Luteipulveratus mongoliensis]|uniref:Sugar isomerase n=1 Tax=Luteipulveratus mongoliensis TaxID=571913 RepID=A0A0K1JFK7_9MICO|nr:SIS domain-containing protein [Luteipulveratus mongoliensis]AKU15507.1 sugar isomerase [Luteipulveratus mongoliensis]
MTELTEKFLHETTSRLERLTALAADGGLDEAITLLADSINAGGVVQAFGTGHSQAFAMEIAGRAGGLIPTNATALRDVVLFGDRDPSVLSDGILERDASIGEELWATIVTDPADVFVIASNSGVNGSIVGLALLAKQHGHQVIAVTSLDHTSKVEPKDPSGKRLSEVADVVIDNLAPYGDTTLALDDNTTGVGAVSSMTAAFIAQLLTIGVAERLAAGGDTPPVYISANIPAGDEHNRQLEERYAGRLRRHA